MIVKLIHSIVVQLFFLLLFLTLSYNSFGQDEEIRYYEENQECLICHGSSKYHYYNEWLEKDVKERMNPYFIIDSAEYYMSNHRSFACVDCHSYDFKAFPHAGELRMEPMGTCLDCHEGDESFEHLHFER